MKAPAPRTRRDIRVIGMPGPRDSDPKIVYTAVDNTRCLTRGIGSEERLTSLRPRRWALGADQCDREHPMRKPHARGPFFVRERASGLGSGGRDLNPRPLGYEPYDIRLWPLGPSLAIALISINGWGSVRVERRHLPLLNPSPPRLVHKSGPITLASDIYRGSPRGSPIHRSIGHGTGTRTAQVTCHSGAGRSVPQGALATEERKRCGSLRTASRRHGSGGRRCHQANLCR